MNKNALALLVLLAMAVSGCHRDNIRPMANANPEPLPVPETQFQSSLGRVALVTRVSLPELHFLQIARDNGAVARTAVADCSGGGGDGSLAGLAVVILFDVGCDVISTSHAQRKAEAIKKLDAGMAPTMADNVLRKSMHDAVVDAVRSDGIRLADDPSMETGNLSEDEPDYHALAARHVDTVLEITLSQLFNEPRQWDQWGGGKMNLDPRLPLEMIAHVRLIKTRDNSTVVSEDFAYRGKRYKYSEWGANHGERLAQAMKPGLDQLGSDISDRLFLLYPFAQRKANAAYCGLAPLAPVDNKADGLSPLLSWESFPRESDVSVAPDDMKRVRHVRYDLLVATGGNGETPTALYRADGLKETSLRLPMKLKPDTRYFWSVRARFELDGRTRVTEWATSCPFENQLVVDGKIYRFYTPAVAKD